VWRHKVEWLLNQERVLSSTEEYEYHLWHVLLLWVGRQLLTWRMNTSLPIVMQGSGQAKKIIRQVANQDLNPISHKLKVGDSCVE